MARAHLSRDSPLSAAAPASRRALIALGALTAINLLNYLDRYLVPPLVPELEQAMGISHEQAGWLWPAFMVVYMIAAPIFGAWGDRGSRTRPIALGVAIWSVATVLSGLARSYPQLYASRALVGIGEAAYAAIAPALLADYFPLSARGRVYAVLNMAIPVGAALGYVLGGFIGHHFGWRAAFFLCGAPGILLAALMLALPDPPRGAQDDSPAVTAGDRPAAAGGVSGAMSVYLSLLRRAPYLLLVLGYAAYTFGLGGLGFWMPTFLQQVRGVSAAEATTGFGAIVIVTGLFGTLAGGWLGDYFLRRSRQGYLWFSAVITLAAAPVAVLALTASAPGVFYPAIVLAELLLFMSTGPINAAIVNIVSPLERASAMALSIFAIHLLGDVPSPPLIGHLAVAGSLARAVLIVPVALAVGGVIWLWSARADRRAPQPALA
ncbi:MAG TPA: MFS transporter [Steroidobacteraceae bacterium]|nr:MFS transporter [Steroidobacteraceae bacterium]